MARITAPATRRHVTLVRLLWLSTFVLVLIGVAIVTRRVLILSGLVAPLQLSESAPLDAAFTRYASLTIRIIERRSRVSPQQTAVRQTATTTIDDRLGAGSNRLATERFGK